ncbi:MAG: hypothetical protein A2W80_09875 [Candidatus Riflebacteria bacterium GWC2_50_8]|nr:MAG: hypothetical protein A2W80_09875 [Candidatus Riflebacteria bacterium GWC2_50_8]
MSHLLVPAIIIIVLFVAAVFLLKMLIPPQEPDDKVPIKEVGAASNVEIRIHGPAHEKKPVQTKPVYYEEPSTERIRHKTGLSFMPMIMFAAIGYLVYANQDLIAEKIPAKVKELTRKDAAKDKPKQTISLAQVEGHAVVEGVNWIKIVATSSVGVPFEGWVSELAVQKEPPKENPMADEFMKKLGLQTNKERIEGIKRLRKVSESLKTSLKDFRPKNE